MIDVVKDLIKKIIVFIIPFLLVFNIYADEGKVITYRYNVVDKNNVSREYLITASIEYVDVKKLTITEFSSNYTGVSEAIEYSDLSDFLSDAGLESDIDVAYALYGITSYSESFSNIIQLHNYENVNDFYEELVSNPENYRPVLKFNKYGKPIIIGFMIRPRAFEETIDTNGNLNEYSSDITEKFLKGELTSSPYYESINFYDKFNINTDINVKFVSANVESYDINNNKKNNISFTGGTCEGYNKGLRDMRQALTGYVNDDGTEVKGICSSKSLNAMQRVASLYDLEYNFDRSVLEEECSEFVFGENGYLNRLIDAQTYYQNIPYDENKPNESAKYKITCLSAQSEYLQGLSLLTVYMPIIDEADKSGCDLIGEDVINFINELFDAIKILCICLCILLCIMDVYKMVVTKESDISKFKSVLVKRVIALIAVFLIPLFVNIVTELINDRYLKDNSNKCTSVLRK